ncbi:MAG: transglutaminase domain-containing protein [Ferruginibacter sp.]
MKWLLFLCLYVCCNAMARGQGFNDMAVDNRARYIPEMQTKSTASIASYINSNFKTDQEKIRAIYTWVVTNIRYDTDSMLPINWSLYPEERNAATLRRRKGVCENYAALFTDIAQKSGFQSFVVSGHTRYAGLANSAGHSWSAVNLQEQWYLCDPTWDASHAGNTQWFLVSPAQFIETHVPFDPLWKLLEHPEAAYDFRKEVSKRNRPAYNFKDSVKIFLQLDSLQQLEASTRRIRQAGLENERQKNWVNYNQMKIAIIYGEKDMDLYNSAVADLNKANAVFNDFIHYRNNRFSPAKTDEQMNSLLAPIAGLLASAWKKIDQMGRVVENFQYDTGTLKERLTALKLKTEDQKNFLKQYVSTSIIERNKLFFK